MKVKIISDNFYDDLEKNINDFIKDKKVIDIKYETYQHKERVLIMYEEYRR